LSAPVFHANNIRKPLLVLQGANDPRVLKAESDEIADAVRKNSVPVEYVDHLDRVLGRVVVAGVPRAAIGMVHACRCSQLPSKGVAARRAERMAAKSSSQKRN
jgi:hypothetical protein